MSEPLFAPRVLPPEMDLLTVRDYIARAEAGMRAAEAELRLKEANYRESRAQLEALYAWEREVEAQAQGRMPKPEGQDDAERR